MLDTNRVYYLTEKMIFKLRDKQYKPDFFVYTDNSYARFVKIIEVKDPGDKVGEQMCNEIYSAFFSGIGIEFEMIRTFDHLTTKYCSKQMQEDWRIRNKETPDVVSICKYCNSEVVAKATKEFCPKKCERAWKHKNIAGFGKHSIKGNTYSANLVTYLKKIAGIYQITTDEVVNNLDYWVQKAKEDGVCPKNKGISHKTLAKYNIKGI